MALEVRRAKSEEAPALTRIAFAAKRHWGYPETWIEQWSGELTIEAEYVAKHLCFVAVEGGVLLGMVSIRIKQGDYWLDHMWVVPLAMGRGIGRRLFSQCERVARQAGATRLMMEADPHAEPFYLRMGAVTIRRKAAAMDGVERFLPIMEKVLSL